jgi:hypothetical protein
MMGDGRHNDGSAEVVGHGEKLCCLIDSHGGIPVENMLDESTSKPELFTNRQRVLAEWSLAVSSL